MGRKQPRSSTQRLNELQTALERILAYPPDNHMRRGEDGYPEEVSYGKDSYRRMVDSYRDAIRAVLKESRNK